MRRVDGDSWNDKRDDFVAKSFQVSAHLFEYHTPPESNEATHVFSNDPRWFKFSNNASHFWPEEAVVIRSFSSSSLREGLAGESPCENKGWFSACERLTLCFVWSFCCELLRLPVNVSLTVGVGKSTDVAVDFTFWPVLFEDFLSEGFVIAEDVSDVRPDPISRECESADTREKVEVPHVMLLV
jgi:hypothetical protein